VIHWRFLAWLGASMAGVAWPAWVWVDRFEGGQGGLVAGLAFTFLSVGAGYHALRWGARRGDRGFVTAALGSTVARLLAFVVFALIAAGATDVHVAVALLTAVAAHFVFGAFEIVYLKRTDGLS